MPKNVAIVNERGSIVNDESPARRLVHAPCRLSLQAVNAAIFAMRGVRNAA